MADERSDFIGDVFGLEYSRCELANRLAVSFRNA